MKLKDKVQKLTEISKEIEDCTNLIELYSEKKINLEKEHSKMLDSEIYDSYCESWNKEGYAKKLKEENEKLLEDLDYLGTWKCPKCGHYSMKDYVCHECGFDKSEGGPHE